MTSPGIRAFFDEPTKTVSYLVWDPATKVGAVIDAVRDFDAASGEVGSRSVDTLIAAAADEGVSIEYALETHVHADHLSGAPMVKARTGATIAIGEHVRDVQAAFADQFGPSDPDGFDRLLGDGERIPIGELAIEVMHVPGHTPADVAYRIGDAVFTGDNLFMPDFGTARCDFPGGSASALFDSIARILALPPETRLFHCHDYKAPGRDTFAWESTVAEQRAANAHIGNGVAKDDYVALREGRDAGLPVPALIIPALQCNLRAGRLPEADSDGVRRLNVPLSLARGAAADALS